MKGLNQFIVDLRNSKDQEEEFKKISQETNKIRLKLQSSTALSGAQKKKYICRLIYIYVLGESETVDFGLRESKELMASKVFSEKKLGYLAGAIFLNNEKFKRKSVFTAKEHLNRILVEIHPQIVQDLQSTDENANCLAIQMIASCFTATNVTIHDTDSNSGKWVEIIDMVYASLTSPLSKPVVKKKAAIALKSLLQIYPDVLVKNRNWAPRILKIVEESKDLGVVTSSVSLLNLMLTLSPQIVRSVVPSIAKRLYLLVVEGQCPKEYYYYDTPAPWLVVKLIQFIENAFLARDTTGTNNNRVLTLDNLDVSTVNDLRQVVAKAIQNASLRVRGLPNRNFQSSILFQAVSLAVFLEASCEAIKGASNALLILISSNDTNTRYLALDALIKLTSRSKSSSYLSSKETFDENLPLILRLLHDNDISIRRKALDLLYTICNEQSYTTIINQLLDYFPHADLQLKSELSVKVAVLAETFATDSTWYVTTMLKLLSIGGGANSNGVGFIDNEIWERIVQIVVNNDDLQKKSCRIIINLLKRPFPSPSTNQQQQQQQEQQPQPLISETMIKVAAFILGEFGEKLSQEEDGGVQIQFRLLYDAYFVVTTSTRAMILTSFLKQLVKNPDADFVPDIIDLFEAETQSIDLEIQTRAYEYLKLSTVHSDFKLAKTIVKGLPAFNQQESPLMSRLGVLAKHPGVTRSKSAVMVQNIRGGGQKPGNEANGQGNGHATQSKALTKNWYSGYHRMLQFDVGIFYEDSLVKITYRLVKNNANLDLKFTFINNAYKAVGKNITGLNVLDLESLADQNNPNYLIQARQLPQADFSDKTNMELRALIRGVTAHQESPIVAFTFMCGGSFNSINLRIPISILRTATPTPLSGPEEFERRWAQIGAHLGQQGESTVEFQLAHRQDPEAMSRSLSRLGFAIILCGTNSTTATSANVCVCGAGILHTQKTNYGALIQAARLDEIGRNLAITVRCTGGGIAEVVAFTLKEIFVGRY
ncbi:uncharacterized protein LODBEIA_P02890 [Lodderomyces beijingensis]|uniref:AP-2 complex subunit alpha n=1 Tax=Lodderomyces beijingensis TaxID=1775926 RepID=A0ABP0ZFV9_9ASCO